MIPYAIGDSEADRAIHQLWRERDNLAVADAGSADYPVATGAHLLFDPTLGASGSVRIWSDVVDAWVSPISSGDGSHTHGAGDITSGILTVTRGGTGRADPAAGALLLGAGNSAMTELVAGVAGYVVRWSGATWAAAQLGFTDLSGSIANGQVPVGAVTQHEAALTIAETQITDGAILARLAAAETVAGAWTFSAAGTALDVTNNVLIGGTLGVTGVLTGNVGHFTNQLFHVGYGRSTLTTSSNLIFGDFAGGNYQQLYWTNAPARFNLSAALEVTGTLELSGTITSTVNGSAILSRTGTSTSQQFIEFGNTTGSLYVGLESSVGGAFFTGSSAYASVFYSNGGDIELIHAGGMRLAATTTGVNVVGTLGVTGNIVTSGTTDPLLSVQATGAGGRTWRVISRTTDGAFVIRDNTGGVDRLTISNVGLATLTGAVTVTGLLLTTLSGTGGAMFRLPHGVAPTSPVNGDVWTTTSAMFARINGATVTLGGAITAADVGTGTFAGVYTFTNRITVSAIRGSAAVACDGGRFTFEAGATVLTAGFLVGAPTGGDKGSGTINTAADIYKNNSAYTNPDYVFELHYQGAAVSPMPADYRFRSLREVEAFTRATMHLPGITRAAAGIFARADMLLEKVEEVYVHLFDHEERISRLERAHAHGSV